MRTVVLLSGGVDSAACAAFYLGLGHDVEALFVDYGQPARLGERVAASSVARCFAIPLVTVVSQGPPVRFSGEIVGRNAFLIFTALLHRPSHDGVIAIGVHDGSSYYDCQKGFVNEIDRILSAYTGGKVSLGVPFLSWSKDMVWDFCIERGLPLELTWSCEAGAEKPCGTCLSCRDVEALHARTK